VRLPFALIIVLGVLWAARPALAEPRIALIIGNSAYARVNLRLANPVNDAAAMDAALKAAGFETIVKLDAKRVDFYKAVDAFAARLRRDPSTVGLFYYAGHGVQADGINYLIPVDADIQAEIDLAVYAFDAGLVLHSMQSAGNEMNIVILDACRDNPLPKTRSMIRGLARMDAPTGTFIAYAAAPGQTAQDGPTGANGIFTAELIKAIAEPGVPLEQMFKRVIAGVKSNTRNSQQPWSESSLEGDFYFFRPTARAPVPPPAPLAPPPLVTTSAPPKAGIDPKQIELADWTRITESKNPADYREYLRNYPQGEFSALAATRLRKLVQPTASKRDTRCESIEQSAQLGETPSNEDRVYLQEHCH